MNMSYILLLSCLFATMGGEANIVTSEGGHIANGRYVIPAGDLIVRIAEEKGAWLTVGDNTELVINGNVRLEGNDFRACDIILVTGKNVNIHGKGSIIGATFFQSTALNALHNHFVRNHNRDDSRHDFSVFIQQLVQRFSLFQRARKTIQQKAAKKFSEEWKDKGYEKGESQKFWLDLLCNVFGIKDFASFITFIIYCFDS